MRKKKCATAFSYMLRLVTTSQRCFLVSTANATKRKHIQGQEENKTQCFPFFFSPKRMKTLSSNKKKSGYKTTLAPCN